MDDDAKVIDIASKRKPKQYGTDPVSVLRQVLDDTKENKPVGVVVAYVGEEHTYWLVSDGADEWDMVGLIEHAKINVLGLIDEATEDAECD